MITIRNLERDTATGGVLVAHWGAELIDGEYSASSYGTVSFTPDPNDPSFVPFEQLDEATVVGWVEAALDLDSIAETLQAIIDDKKAPQTVAGLPW